MAKHLNALTLIPGIDAAASKFVARVIIEKDKFKSSSLNINDDLEVNMHTMGPKPKFDIMKLLYVASLLSLSSDLLGRCNVFNCLPAEVHIVYVWLLKFNLLSTITHRIAMLPGELTWVSFMTRPSLSPGAPGAIMAWLEI